MSILPEAKLDILLAHHASLEAQLLGQVNYESYVKITRELAELNPLIDAVKAYRAANEEIAGIAALISDPATEPEMRGMAEAERETLSLRSVELAKQIRLALLHKDAMDDRNVVLEIRAGTGGDEAALFVAEVFRMYMHFAESKRWKVEVLSDTPSGIGNGLKDVTAIIEGDRVYSLLKYESGVHRVQRVPATETQGRVHTSAITVAVLPEAEEVDIKIEAKDLRIDTFCSSGPGGQSVNTTYSAVRITHLPTNTVVSCQDEKSQIKNREKGMRVLRARLYEIELKKREEKAAADQAAKTDIGWGHQIRSYVLQPYQMVKDLRTGVQTSDTEGVLDGDLDEFMAATLAQRAFGTTPGAVEDVD